MSDLPIGAIPPAAVAPAAKSTIGGEAAAKTARLSGEELASLKKTAADFEALFIKQLLGAMRKTIPKGEDGGLFGESQGEKIFKDLLDGEYAGLMSRRPNGLGLKESLIKQMTGALGGPVTDPAADLQRLRAEKNSLSAASQLPIKKGKAFP